MCRLRIKIRVIGKRNQRFLRFILTPKDIKQRSRYILNLGSWDTRQNKQIRFVIFNIYKIMEYYRYGATMNKRILCLFYYYFLDIQVLNNWEYFKQDQMCLFLENEIKKIYL
jgi:ribosomal protein S16